jgi:hypothetical protein
MRTDNFDRELDAALAKYAAVEPRSGMEQRILANLQGQENHDGVRGWWRWPVSALGAVVACGTLTVGLHRTKTANVSRVSVVAERGAQSHDVQTVSETVANARNSKARSGNLQKRRMYRVDVVTQKTPIDGTPSLPQFPAPEPMSEQEELLVRFVQDDPRGAALVAEARTERLRREDDEIKVLIGTEGSEQQSR